MRQILSDRGVKTVATLAIGVGVWTCGTTQSLQWLGVLPGGIWSEARAVSADGRVVAGIAENVNFQHRAFRWSRTEGIRNLGTLWGDQGYSYAYGISADGSVIVGGAGDPARARRPFQWRRDTGMQMVGDWNCHYAEACDTSADGRVIVGRGLWCDGPNSREIAFRWSAEQGLQDLVLDSTRARAYGVSADGSVVVGEAFDAYGYSYAFRWSATQGVQALTDRIWTRGGRADAVSADGTVVVGHYTGASAYYHAFRWDTENGFQDIGRLGPFYHMFPTAVSADGNTIVGYGHGEVIRAFRWTPSRGLETLNTAFASLLNDGSSLWYAYDISPDGRYIVGQGTNARARRSEAFLLDTWRTGDTNGDGCINDADLLAVLFAFGTPGTGYTRHEDINKNGIVDDADLLTVLLEFGNGC